MNTVGTVLFCYVKVEDFASHLITDYYNRSVSIQTKHLALFVNESDYWIGRIKNHQHL